MRNDRHAGQKHFITFLFRVEWNSIPTSGNDMNLDDISAIKTNDPQDMLAHILALPDQLDQAWQLGFQPDLSPGDGIRQVLIAGMGGSAIGADLLEAYTRPFCRVPVNVHREYGLPAWAEGEQTLVIASSHSGNTEETLSAFSAARERGCRLMAVSTGGALKEQALAAGSPILQFEHHGQPRSAVGFSFGLLLAAFTRLGLIPDQAAALKSSSAAMREQMRTLIPESLIKVNPAKRLAGQVIGRLPVIVGADFLTPVARRWKGQFNELAKCWAQYDSLPEFDHNSLAGLEQPDQVLPKLMVLFLNADACPPEDRLRVDLTRRVMMTEGVNTDIINARGVSRLEALWTLVHYGDFTAYYLASLYEADPTPIPAITSLKAEMQRARQ
jgi:glucose/mannose-6-phosphate isomerase